MNLMNSFVKYLTNKVMALILWDINNLLQMSCCKYYFDTFQYTYGAIGEIMDVVNELGKCALLDMYEKYHICVCGLG
jgi:hypothetical protein